MKKPTFIIVAGVAACCAVFAAGCAGGKTQNLAVLSSNWYSGTGYNGFQPTICEDNAPEFSAEKITYKVTHEQLAEKYQNKYYSVTYGEGTYVTEFYAADFSYENFGYPSEFIEEYSEKGTFKAYCYKTVLDIPSVTFTLKSDETAPKTLEGDYVETESWFLSVKDYLRPLYSVQKVKNVTPNTRRPAKLEEGYAYKTYDRVYENFYSVDGKSVITKTTDNRAKENKTSVSESIDLSKSKNSLFDLNSLDVVARATNLSAGSGLLQAISLYIPKSGTVENFNLAGSDRPLLSDETKNKELLTALEGKLKEKELYTPVEKGLQTVAVTVNYTGTQPGGAQTYWFAAIENKRNNVGRATMLKLSMPVSYNLGTINYTLESFQSNLWNK